MLEMRAATKAIQGSDRDPPSPLEFPRISKIISKRGKPVFKGWE